MYKGIILDKMQQNAFLSMAAHEGLICERGITDGMFDMVTRSTPTLWLAQTILEQFMVAGTVYVDPSLYKCMDGELIEKGIIMPYQKFENDKECFFAFDINTIYKMMLEKGFDSKYYTVEKIGDMLNEWCEEVKEFLEYEDKYNFNYEQLSLLKILDIEPKESYVGVDIDYFIKLGDLIYQSPIFDVLNEYRKLFEIAYHNDLLSPVINAIDFNKVAPDELSKNVSVLESSKSIMILKYTSERLNRIYTAASLRDSIKLIETEEAKAYRKKVNEWLIAFSEQKYDNMQIIEDDILKAQKAMKYTGIIENVGKVCATSGVVSTVLTPVFLPMGVVSAVATFIGCPTAFFNPMRKHLWASFGIYKG